MKPSADRKIKFFGCSLDCDEKYDSIQDKLHIMKTAEDFYDPLDGVMASLSIDIPTGLWDNTGTLSIPTWLGPKPLPGDRPKISTENFISFIDGNGCRKTADAADRFVTERILPHIPCLIGIDHSVTGGVFSALSRYYGCADISLIIIDSHTDAIPMSALSGAVQYDAETNPSSVHDLNDPFLYNRPDSYNAATFVHSLIAEKQVDPENLYFIGVSDYPEIKSLRIKDARIKKYTQSFVRLKDLGAKIITKKDCKLTPGKIKGFLSKISTPYVYVSVDMDIGAGNALEGVRFRNWKGLDESQIYKIAGMVRQVLSGSIRLAGMDICEIDPRRAGLTYPSGTDQTYKIAANLIKKIAFN